MKTQRRQKRSESKTWLGGRLQKKTPNRREELMISEEKKNVAKRKWFITNRITIQYVRYTF